MSEFTEQELDNIFNKKIVPRYFKDTTPSQTPEAFLIGGQPGAGKSSLYKIAYTSKQGNNLVEINIDEFRQYHPRAEEFEKEFKEQASIHTHEFAGEMKKRALNKALTEKYNFILEGTFKTPEATLKILTTAKEQGYKTSVYIITCPFVVSYASTLVRYAKLIKTEEHSRATPTDYQDVVVKNLAKNIKKVFDAKLHNEFRIFNRYELLFTEKDDPKIIEVVVNKELNRSLLQAETDISKKDISDFNEVSTLPRDSQLLLDNYNKTVEDYNKTTGAKSNKHTR